MSRLYRAANIFLDAPYEIGSRYLYPRRRVPASRIPVVAFDPRVFRGTDNIIMRRDCIITITARAVKKNSFRVRRCRRGYSRRADNGQEPIRKRPVGEIWRRVRPAHRRENRYVLPSFFFPHFPSPPISSLHC